LGNYRAPNSEELVKELLQSYQSLGCNMSLKIHFLHSHYKSFPNSNLSDYSDEMGERFYQDLKTMEQQYQGALTLALLGDY